MARYRAGDADARRQIRLVVAAAGSLALVTLLFLAATYAGSSGPLLDVTTVALAAALLISPLAILLAMNRYRLYELDHLVGRTFVIASTTAILAGVFAATQRLLQVVFTVVLGESSDLTYVVSTLLVVTAINPLKEHLEAIVDGWEEGQAAGTGFDVSAAPAGPEPDALDPTIAAIIDTRIEQRLEEWLVVHGQAREPDVSHLSVLSSHDAAMAITADGPPSPAEGPNQGP